MPRSTTERLADYEQQYRELAAQLATIGLIHPGSVTRRYTRCATPGCKCHADPPEPHGPYYQWTAKVNGKTVTRRLSERDAELYQEWIDNDRRMRTYRTDAPDRRQSDHTEAQCPHQPLNTQASPQPANRASGVSYRQPQSHGIKGISRSPQNRQAVPTLD